ncbi:MAG: PTS lactose/cellobiose transporter subunit IIA [Intestinibacter sp.]
MIQKMLKEVHIKKPFSKTIQLYIKFHLGTIMLHAQDHLMNAILMKDMAIDYKAELEVAAMK